jgi:DNA-binding NtrC family response regulator
MRLKQKRKRPAARRDVDRDSSPRIKRLKLIARKLLNELDTIDVRSERAVDKINFYDEVKRFEERLITQALIRCEGHQLRAAHFLNLNATTLNAKIKQYNIQINAFSTHQEADGSRDNTKASTLRHHRTAVRR